MAALVPTLSPSYLSPMIRRADNLPGKPLFEPGQKLVAIHPVTRQTRDSTPFWGADQWRCYLVGTTASVKKCDLFQVALSDSRGTIRRDITCEISIRRLEPQWEYCLTRALSTDSSPEIAFERKVERWLQDFIDDTEKTHSDCLRRFARHRAEAQAYVRTNAGPVMDEAGSATGLGLHLTCTLRLPEDDLKPIEVTVDLPRLLCSDYDEPFPSRMEAQLEVPRDNEAMIAKAQMTGHLTEDFREDFERDIPPWFRRECTAHDYCLKNGEVRSRLRTNLQDSVGKHGREIVFLRVRPLQEIVLPKAENISHVAVVDIDITQADSPEQTCKVRVNHKGQIETVDAALWLRTQATQKITDQVEWIKERLQKRTEDSILGKSYGEIVVEFDRSLEDTAPAPPVSGFGKATDAFKEPNAKKKDLKSLIQEQVENDLRSAGLSIKMFTSTPDLPARLLLVDGFRFDTENPVEDTVFKTSDSRVDFSMVISVRGSLRSLERFKPYLTGPKADIASRLRGAAILAARDIMSTLSPKQLFLAFDTPIGPGKPTPRRAITHAIETRLGSKEGPNAVCEHVVLRPLAGKFNERWEELTPAKDHALSLKVSPQGALDDHLTFEVKFRVIDIDDTSWANFQNHCTQHFCTEQISAISEKLETFGSIRLGSFKADTLRKQKPMDFQTHRDEIFADAVEQISLEMGLKVKVTSISPVDSSRTGKLKGLAESIFDNDIDAARQLHNALKEAKLDPLGVDQEKLHAQREAFNQTFGGALSKIPALPGSNSPAALGAGDKGADEEETFFGKE